MRDRLKDRLKSLEEELAKGQEMMAKLDQERANLRDKLMRIGGAIQVLQEELTLEEESNKDMKEADN